MKKIEESRLAKIPAWVLIAIVFVLSIASAVVLEHVTLPGTDIPGIIGTLFYLVFIPLACFLICILHPKNAWFTPFLCNPVALLGTVFHPIAWTTLTEYLLWVISFALSFFGALAGARIAKRRLKDI